jgi:hypothetical protein
MINDWYEVWVDESTDIPYVLFLCPSKDNPTEFLIIDPKENDRVVQTLPDYETARLWLREDEYILVRGRMKIDE